jgi:predicted metal-dependent peptidase
MSEKYLPVEDIPSLLKELDKTKIGFMMQGGTFLISVGLMMKSVFTNEVARAATDGTAIYFKPEFFLSLSKQERIGTLAHEIMHIALMHPIRRGNRDHNTYNSAADYVINDILLTSGYTLPVPHLHDVKYRGWSTEQVYDDLIKNKDDGTTPNILGMDIDFSVGDDVDAKGDLSSSMQDIVIKARAQAKMESSEEAGKIPGEVDRMIENLINPLLDWTQLLSRFMDTTAKNDHSWRSPNRRFFPNFYLPSMQSESLDHLTVAIDTSGSVNDEMLAEMLTEIKSIYDTYQPTNMTIIDCDKKIHNIHIIDDTTDILRLKITGGGGTSFLPVLDYCKENNTNVLLYFTDLWAESISPDDGYEFDTLWICYSKHQPQEYGETIYYESNTTR